MPTGARRRTPVERYWEQMRQQQERQQQLAWSSYWQQQQQVQQQAAQPQPSPYTVASPAAGAPAGTYSMATPATTPTPSTMSSTTSTGTPPPVIGDPAYYEKPANYYESSVGNADNAYQAYRDIADDTGSLAWDALMTNKDAQLELYNSASGASESFGNWLRNRGDTFYNRYVSDSAQTNDPAMQFSDWLHGKTGSNIQHEYLRSAPESRNYFPGLMQPSARWVVQG